VVSSSGLWLPPPSPEATDIQLLLWYGFEVAISAQDLLQALHNKFKDAAGIEKRKRLVCLLKHWIESTFSRDFLHDRDSKESLWNELLSFLESIQSALPAASNRIKLLMLQARQEQRERIKRERMERLEFELVMSCPSSDVTSSTATDTSSSAPSSECSSTLSSTPASPLLRCSSDLPSVARAALENSDGLASSSQQQRSRSRAIPNVRRHDRRKQVCSSSPHVSDDREDADSDSALSSRSDEGIYSTPASAAALAPAPSVQGSLSTRSSAHQGHEGQVRVTGSDPTLQEQNAHSSGSPVHTLSASTISTSAGTSRVQASLATRERKRFLQQRRRSASFSAGDTSMQDSPSHSDSGPAGRAAAVSAARGGACVDDSGSSSSSRSSSSTSSPALQSPQHSASPRARALQGVVSGRSGSGTLGRSANSSGSGSRLLEYSSPRLFRRKMLSRGDKVPTFFSLHVRELADHIYHHEAHMFSKINYWDLVQASAGKQMVTPIRRMVERSNRVCFWVATQVVKERRDQKRAALIKKFVRLASKCQDRQNYNALVEVVGGLHLHPVQRLTDTWKLVPERVMNRFRSLSRLIDSKRNYSAYRRALADAKGPLLPYLGVHLRDATMAREGNPTRVEKELLNFEKIEMIGSLLLQFRTHQRNCSTAHLQLVPLTREQRRLLRSPPVLTESELDELSRQCQPPRRHSLPSDSNDNQISEMAAEITAAVAEKVKLNAAAEAEEAKLNAAAEAEEAKLNAAAEEAVELTL